MGLQIRNLYSELGTVVLGHVCFDVPLLKSFLKLHTVLQSVGHVYDGDTPSMHVQWCTFNCIQLLNSAL